MARIALASVFYLFACGIASAGGLQVIDLGTFDGGEAQPFDINVHGEITGSVHGPPDNSFVRPFLWLPQAKYGLPAGMNSISNDSSSPGHGINDLGQVVGGIINQRWLPSPAYGYPSGWSNLTSTGPLIIPGKINNQGQLALYAGGDAALYLPTPAYGLSAGFNALPGISSARAINELGQLAGYSGAFNSGTAFFYLIEPAYGRSAGRHLVGLLPGMKYSHALAINNRGEVVGFDWDQSNNVRSFIWRPDNSAGAAGLFDLGGVSPEATLTNIYAQDINDNGWVVGYRWIDHVYTAFLWSQEGGMVDLNTLLDPSSGWVLQQATVINNLGQVSGTGLHNGLSAAFVMVVPEPSILTIGLLGILVFSSHRRGIRGQTGVRRITASASWTK